MTIAEALQIKKGDYITHPHRIANRTANGVEYQKLRVTDAWANEKRTIVMFRCHALGGQWIHAEAFGGRWKPPVKASA